SFAASRDREGAAPGRLLTRAARTVSSYRAGNGCDRRRDEGGHFPVCHFQLGGTVIFRREDFRRCFPGNLRLRLTRRTAGRYPVLWDRHTSLTKGAEYGREKSHQRTEQSRRL